MTYASRILFVAFICFALPAMAATPQETFINGLGQKAISVLGDPSVTVAKRHATFAKLFIANFDLDKIGHFVLGRHWSEATPAQQAQYQKLFQQMVITVYTQRFDNYAGQKFSVKGSTPVDGADTDTMVHSVIEQADGQAPIAVDWRVRTTGSTNKIIDVAVEGVSMSVTQRSDFDAVVQQSGIDGLLQNMKSRVDNGGNGTPAAKSTKPAADDQ